MTYGSWPGYGSALGSNWPGYGAPTPWQQGVGQAGRSAPWAPGMGPQFGMPPDMARQMAMRQMGFGPYQPPPGGGQHPVFPQPANPTPYVPPSASTPTRPPNTYGSASPYEVSTARNWYVGAPARNLWDAMETQAATTAPTTASNPVQAAFANTPPAPVTAPPRRYGSMSPQDMAFTQLAQAGGNLPPNAPPSMVQNLAPSDPRTAQLTQAQRDNILMQRWRQRRGFTNATDSAYS